jgi:phenylpropionate dioxygenase-like ring-hydroxylating dioxygenase large terminal subunit
MWHDLTAKQLGRTMTVVYATPIRKGECRLFARFPFKFASTLPALFLRLTPRWYSHIGNNNILEDDQIFLHYQERYLAAKGGSANFARAFYLPTRADRFVLALRQWVNQYDADPFPGEPLTPPLSTEQLLDRYHSHTKHCASCRNALAKVQQLKTLVPIVAVIVWATLPLLAVTLGSSLLFATVGAIVPLILGAVWLALGKLERQFYEGRAIPPRNLPEKPGT